MTKDRKKKPLHVTAEASEVLAGLNLAMRRAFREQGSDVRSVPLSYQLYTRVHTIVAELAGEETAGRRGPNAKRRDLLWRHNADWLAFNAVRSARLREVPRGVHPKGIVAHVVTTRQAARKKAAGRRRRGMKPALESVYETVARVFVGQSPDLPHTADAVREAYRRHRARILASPE